MKFEKIKFLAEQFERESFESLVQRKATSIEFAWNGFFEIHEQPERLSEKDRKVCDSPNTPTKGSESSRND